ncbi:MAG: GNAT family N-acetyltransferase [Clostridia bacterium]|nr:GNAT family N-acetyltransferase [Clostridia bacterium]
MIRIRPYKDSDEARVLSWCRDEETFYRWTAGVLGAPPLTPARFRKTGELMRFTALMEREPVGFFTLRNPDESPDHLRIGFVIVDPARRRQGIGTAMLRQALVYAFRVYGAEKVSLGVLEDNLPAYACYRAVGFRETGIRETYPICGVAHVAAELEITEQEARP